MLTSPYSCVRAQSCPTLCDPTDCSPPGSSVCGILQARILEWVAISFSRGSSRPRVRTHCLLHFLHYQADSLPLSHWGSSKMWCRQYKIQDMPNLGEQRHAWLLMHLLAHWDAEHLSIDSYFSPPLKVRRRETQVWWQFSQLWKTGIIPRSGRGDGANVHSRK